MRIKTPDATDVNRGEHSASRMRDRIAPAQRRIVDRFRAGSRQDLEDPAVAQARHLVGLPSRTNFRSIVAHRQASQVAERISRAKTLLLVSVLTLVVAACGGGGDSGA